MIPVITPEAGGEGAGWPTLMPSACGDVAVGGVGGGLHAPLDGRRALGDEPGQRLPPVVPGPGRGRVTVDGLAADEALVRGDLDADPGPDAATDGGGQEGPPGAGHDDCRCPPPIHADDLRNGLTLPGGPRASIFPPGPPAIQRGPPGQRANGCHRPLG